MAKYRLTTYVSLFGKFEVVEFPDQVYGEWIIYENGVASYHVNIHNEVQEANRIIKDFLLRKEHSIHSLVRKINIKHNKNLHLKKSNLLSFKKKSEVVDIELPLLPIEFLTHQKVTLINHIPDIEEFILKSVKDFIIKKGQINTLGIYASITNGWISLNFNKNSTLQSTSFNCPDFEYVEEYLISIVEWEKEFEKDCPQIIDIDID